MVMTLRYCLFGYGIGGMAGLALAPWLGLLLSILVFWLGGGMLSVGLIYCAYWRQSAVRTKSLKTFAPPMQEIPEPSG